MLLDKKRVSLVTKIGAIVIAVAFVASLMVWLKPSYEAEGPTQNNLSEKRKYYQEEAKNLEKAVEANPNNLKAWVALGDTYFDWASLETQLVSSAKDKNKALSKTAVYWVRAVRAYQQALALDSKDYDVRTKLAVCYLQLGQLDKSVGELNYVLGKRPDFAAAYFYLGMAYKGQNRIKDAEQAWGKFLKLNPSGREADFVRQQLSELKKGPQTPAKSTTSSGSPTPNK